MIQLKIDEFKLNIYHYESFGAHDTVRLLKIYEAYQVKVVGCLDNGGHLSSHARQPEGLGMADVSMLSVNSSMLVQS